MKKAIVISVAERIETDFIPAVPLVRDQKQRFVEENLPGLAFADIVLVRTLASFRSSHRKPWMAARLIMDYALGNTLRAG